MYMPLSAIIAALPVGVVTIPASVGGISIADDPTGAVAAAVPVGAVSSVPSPEGSVTCP